MAVSTLVNGFIYIPPGERTQAFCFDNQSGNRVPLQLATGLSRPRTLRWLRLFPSGSRYRHLFMVLGEKRWRSFFSNTPALLMLMRERCDSQCDNRWLISALSHGCMYIVITRPVSAAIGLTPRLQIFSPTSPVSNFTCWILTSV